MEKMNQVSVSEFMNLTKEEMYDNAVKMVEKYNRLVDICNDSAERIATLVKENERRITYADELNKDIAKKAVKIKLLEQEIEDRKEGYWVLKEKMDTQYISIDDHNDVCEAYKKKVVELKKESEKWQDLAKMNRDTICDQYDVCEDFKRKIVELEEKVKHQRENLDGINKTLDIRNKEHDSLVKTIQTARREIEAHESENKRLSERIIELKEEVEKRDKCIMEKNGTINTAYDLMANLRKEVGAHEDENKKLEKRIEELKVDLDFEREKYEKLAKDGAFKEQIDRNRAHTIDELNKQVHELRECWERAEKRYVSECKLVEDKCNEVENLEKYNKKLETAYKILVEKSVEHMDNIKQQGKRILYLEEENKKLKSEYEDYRMKHEGVNAPIPISLESVRKNGIPYIELTPEEKAYCQHDIKLVVFDEFLNNQSSIITPQIKKAYFNGPTTTVLFEDETHTCCTCGRGDTWNPDAGIAICIAKRIYGCNFKKLFRDLIGAAEEDNNKRFQKACKKSSKKIDSKNKVKACDGEDKTETGKKTARIKKEEKGIPCGEDAIE